MTPDHKMPEGRTMPPDEKTHMSHIPALDGVRALSILFVLAAHTLPLGPKVLQLNATSGAAGMSLFFCLSGFLIISLLSRNADAVSFLIRRVLRIVPAVALYVLLMVLLFGIGWQAVAENALFITNYNFEGRGHAGPAADTPIIAPMTHLWSLSVEMHFYIAIGLAALILGRRCIWLVIPAALVVTANRIALGIEINIATHLRVDEILSGGILALVTLHYGPQIRAALAKGRRALWAFCAALVLWVLSCHPAFEPIMYFRPYTAALLVGIVIHCRLAVLHDWLEGRIASYLAKISYALYIYHPLMVFGWMNEGTTMERYLFKRPISWVLAFAAAHASTFWWEARWQALARRLTAGRKPVTA